MSKLGFLKSKKFWLTAAHVALIGAGAAAAAMTGTPIPLVVTSALNALVTSPLDKSVSLSDVKTGVKDVQTIESKLK